MAIKKIKKLRLTNFVKALGLNISNELLIVNGEIADKNVVKDTRSFEIVNSEKCILCPGFIDPQINGFHDCDFWDLPPPSFDKIDKLRIELAHHGVTAFCPTIITSPKEKIINFVNHINSYLRQSHNDLGARILGIHIEGVFITKAGVHKNKYIEKELTIDKISPFVKENVILYTLAPELDKTGDAIKFLQENNILVSIGHSNATYSQGELLIKKYGLGVVTHMFNSLRGVEGFSHRGNNTKNIELIREKLKVVENIEPDKDGIILSIMQNENVLCMVISDGVHVNKEVVSLLKQYKNKNNFALASDLVSNKFFNLAKTEGKLGGGQMPLDECITNLIKWNVSTLEDSLMCASKPIADRLKIAKDIGLGSISIGKKANLVIWDTEKNRVKGTIIGENIFLNY